jgi:sporulation protein YlmC with PRC-barrel domain
MQNVKTTRRWSEIHDLNVVDPNQGKILGRVEDFFVQEGTNAIYALSVLTRLYGSLTLPITGIKAVEGERVTVKNEQMLLKAIPPFLHGQNLIGRKVVGESGSAVGSVKDIILGVEPPSTMRITGVEIANSNSDRNKHIFTADSLSRYDDAHETLVIDDKMAKRLR